MHWWSRNFKVHSCVRLVRFTYHDPFIRLFTSRVRKNSVCFSGRNIFEFIRSSLQPGSDPVSCLPGNFHVDFCYLKPKWFTSEVREIPVQLPRDLTSYGTGCCGRRLFRHLDCYVSRHAPASFSRQYPVGSRLSRADLQRPGSLRCVLHKKKLLLVPLTNNNIVCVGCAPLKCPCCPWINALWRHGKRNNFRSVGHLFRLLGLLGICTRICPWDEQEKKGK